MAGVDEGEQGGRRGVSDTGEPRGERFQTKPADTEVHKITGHEHGEDISPAEKAVPGCKQGDDFEWEVLGRPLSGHGCAAQVPRPVGRGQVGQLLQEWLSALVKIRSRVLSEDDMVGEDESGEVRHAQ